jgi:hypothetical protein
LLIVGTFSILLLGWDWHSHSSPFHWYHGIAYSIVLLNRWKGLPFSIIAATKIARLVIAFDQ